MDKAEFLVTRKFL